jgi:CPA1 family monovalent cation:H+ antiporter
VLQGGTLPWLIRLLRVEGIDARQDTRELAGLLETISEAGLEALDDIESEATADEPIDPDVLERVRQTTFLRTDAAWERTRSQRASHERPHQQFRELRLRVVTAERERLLVLRAQGTYSSRVLTEAQALLDLEETRLARRLGDQH